MVLCQAISSGNGERRMTESQVAKSLILLCIVASIIVLGMGVGVVLENSKQEDHGPQFDHFKNGEDWIHRGEFIYWRYIYFQGTPCLEIKNVKYGHSGISCDWYWEHIDLYDPRPTYPVLAEGKRYEEHGWDDWFETGHDQGFHHRWFRLQGMGCYEYRDLKSETGGFTCDWDFWGEHLEQLFPGG